MPAYVAITRKVKPGMEEPFKKSLRKFVRESLHLPGTTCVHLIYPAPGADEREFGILRSFENDAARKAFYASDLLANWEKEVAPMTVGSPIQRQLHGLEAFFREVGKAPPRWKMALVTWLGMFPGVWLWSAILQTPLSGLNDMVVAAVIDAFVVISLAWFLMPFLTWLLSAWLITKEYSSSTTSSDDGCR